jgi:hypothetical protein
MSDPATAIFVLADDVVIENFGDSALVLRGANRKVFEINHIAQVVLSKTDGQRPVVAVASEIMQIFAMSKDDAIRETVASYNELQAHKLIRLKGGTSMSTEEFSQRQFVKNPDVLLRESGPDGALLFDPDTNQVKVLNPTGLFIWQQCDGTLNVSEIIQAMLAVFDGANEAEMAKDVQAFLEAMVETGFIGSSVPAES